MWLPKALICSGGAICRPLFLYLLAKIFGAESGCVRHLALESWKDGCAAHAEFLSVRQSSVAAPRSMCCVAIKFTRLLAARLEEDDGMDLREACALGLPKRLGRVARLEGHPLVSPKRTPVQKRVHLAA